MNTMPTEKDDWSKNQRIADTPSIKQAPSMNRPFMSEHFVVAKTVACLLAFSTLLLLSSHLFATVTPDDGNVYLMTDESAKLSASPDPDPGTPPNMDCCDEDGNPVDPEPTITKKWTGDVIDPDDPDKVRVDTDSEGTKTVTVEYYVKWLCPGEDDPNPDDPGDHIAGADETVTYEVVKPEVTKVSFNNGHALKKWNGKSDISNPVWEKALAGAVTKDEPSAYTKSGAAEAELFIEASDPLSNSTSVEVKGVAANADDENFHPESATFHNWTWSSGELVLSSSPLYASVNYYDTLDIKWQYRVEKPDGGFGAWVDMNESNHKLYTTYETPIESPLYDFALEKACGYAVNKSTPSTIASELMNGVHVDITYDPQVSTIPAEPLDEYTAGGTVCGGNAILMKYLAESVGVAGDVKYIWGGSSSTTVCFYKFPSSWWGPSFKVLKPAHPDKKVGADPVFTYHALTLIASAYYDPSYGAAGLIALNKTAPAGVSYGTPYFSFGRAVYGPLDVTVGTNSPSTSRQIGSAWPPATIYWYDGTP